VRPAARGGPLRRPAAGITRPPAWLSRPMTTLLALDPRLHRPLLDLVVATLWSDGQVADREIAAARGAQVALGLLHPDDDAARAIGLGPSGSWRGLAAAPARERTLAYAAASWTALADGVVDPGEARFLDVLQRSLRLKPARIALATGLARWVNAQARAEGLPPHRSFAQLLAQGARRVAQLEERRPQAA
jgi:hypothetical protein